MKQKPTTSQYSYMVTGLLTAKIQRNGVITQDDVKEAVETAEMAYEMIFEIIRKNGLQVIMILNLTDPKKI